jgi:hypothetical protein
MNKNETELNFFWISIDERIVSYNTIAFFNKKTRKNCIQAKKEIYISKDTKLAKNTFKFQNMCCHWYFCTNEYKFSILSFTFRSSYAVPWWNVPGRNVLWIFRPRNFVMKRPWDTTVLGTKQSLDKTSSANLRQNVPIFRDGLSVAENKT